MNPQPHKTCPACGQPAVLSMMQCGRCGYDYSAPQPWTAPVRQRRAPSWLKWAAAAAVPLLLVALLFAVAATGPRYPFIGTWRGVSDYSVLTWAFTADGTVTQLQEQGPPNAFRDSNEYTWKNSGNTLLLFPRAGARRWGNEPWRYAWQLSDDRRVLILHPLNGDPRAPLSLTRAK